MKINELHVDGFGVWKGLELGKLSDSLNVFYGRNEAGKTTLMQFVRTVLYGFSPERRERYLGPLHGEQAGGRLRLTSAGQGYEVRRHLNPGDEPTSLGDPLVTSEDGGREGQGRLAQLLGGVDESIFNNVFAVGLREIQELATLNDTAAAEQLYRLTGGLDRVSLVDVMRELAASRQRLLATDDRPSQIVQLASQWEKLHAEIDELAAQGDRWSQLVMHRTALFEDIADQERSLARIERQSRLIEVAMQVRDRWLTRQRLSEQLAEIGPLTPLPENAIDRLDRFNARLVNRQEQAVVLRSERSRLKQEAASLPINRPLWSRAPRIEALSEHAPWIASLQEQLEVQRAAVAQCDKELGVFYEQMRTGQPENLASLPDVPRSKLVLLRAPAQAIREAQRLLTAAEEEQAKASREAAEAAHELETALVERDQTDLAEALDQAGELAGKFRRRIQLEERIDQMLRRRDDLEEEGLDLREHLVLPLPVLTCIGAAFILGVVLILLGLFGGTFFGLSNATGWAVLGMFATGGAILAKVLLERQSAERLAGCTTQLQSVQNQIKQAQKERDTLDRELPSGGGQLDSRLRAAEADVAALEALLPLNGGRQAATGRAKAAADAAAEAESALKTARHKWRGALRTIGLPEGLSPKQAQQFARGCGKTARLRKRREIRFEEFRRIERDLEAFTTRITQLMQEAGLKPQAADPQARLKQLILAVSDQKLVVERRQGVVRQARALRRELHKVRREIEDQKRRKKALLASAGTEEERQLRELADLHRRTDDLTRQHDEITSQITFALAGQFTEESIADEITREGLGSLSERRADLAAQLSHAQGRQSQLYERRGEINHELKALAADRRLAEAKLELGCVGEKLRQAVGRWQVLAVTGRLLEAIRAIYETERQPETLGEASRYLTKLTEGHYTRIWTPLGEQVLRIDDRHGDPLPLDVLSSGTREAVFLSLRLALVAAYARRGAMLPILLDDVLVNFDTERAKAAASVLAEFARGGFQMLLFTCHEHIVRIFRGVKVEARYLPVRGQVVEAMPVDEQPPSVEIPLPEPVREPPLRKKRRKLAEETPTESAATLPLPAPTPPPLPIRVVQPQPVVEADTTWRDSWWFEDASGAFAFDSNWIDVPEPAGNALRGVPEYDLDIRDEEFPFDDTPGFESTFELHELDEEIWFDDEPELPKEEPAPRLHLETVPPRAPTIRYERRFAWESPEMYIEERSGEAA